MQVQIDASKILTAILLALVMYIGKTVYELDVEMELVKYKVDQSYVILHDVYSSKADK